ncbi:hypothetical protein K1W54_24565 [Micromonospora sp. CPCC 205371]|nr:hypothetical protein [Micromonospora sp. CPCC 205371]
MIEYHICPPCGQPVANQPQHRWTQPPDQTDQWRHLGDDTAVCRTRDGQLAEPVPATVPMPDNSDLREWITQARRLFTEDGLVNPGQVTVASAATEHFTALMLLATDPHTAHRVIAGYSDVAALVGSLHRLARLLARIAARAGDHIISPAFEPADAASPSEQALLAGHRGIAEFELREAANRLVDAAVMAGRAWVVIRNAAAFEPTDTK